MRRIILMLLAASGAWAQDLERVAEAATAMVDGDVCRRIQTARSIAAMDKVDKRDPYKASDDYDVNDSPFLQTKKTLIRLARLCPTACDVNLWMRAPGETPMVQVVVRNVNEMSQFWNFGELRSPMPAEMKRVLDAGERVTVRRRPGMVSVLAPVYDSMGDIAGLVEVVGRMVADPRENVK